MLLRSGGTTRDAVHVLRGVGAADGHTFWPDELGYEAVDLRGVVGHRQVTDAYLAALARLRGRLATLDSALAALHDDVATLLTADAWRPVSAIRSRLRAARRRYGTYGGW